VPADALMQQRSSVPHLASRCLVFTHEVAALFCAKCRHLSHFESVTSNRKSDYTSIDAYLLQEHSCQISLRSYLKRQRLMLFLKRSPQQEQEQQQQD